MYVRFQVLTAASMMFRAVFWVILPCRMTIILHGSITQKTALNIKMYVDEKVCEYVRWIKLARCIASGRLL
jgi:hypothetical protein